MEFTPERFARQFMERTLENLKFIDKAHETKPDCGPYEVTQLINSLFGLLIIPYEKFKHRYSLDYTQIGNEDNLANFPAYKQIQDLIDALKKKKLLLSGRPPRVKPNAMWSTYPSDYTFPVTNFIRHLRNALAHGGDTGLSFWPKRMDAEISSIEFHDKYVNLDSKIYEGPDPEFFAELDIDEIRRLCTYLVELYNSVEQEVERTGHTKDYAGNFY